jgi:hypothetical protein
MAGDPFLPNWRTHSTDNRAQATSFFCFLFAVGGECPLVICSNPKRPLFDRRPDLSAAVRRGGYCLAESELKSIAEIVRGKLAWKNRRPIPTQAGVEAVAEAGDRPAVSSSSEQAQLLLLIRFV